MYGDAKYYHVKQIIRSGKCVGYLAMIGKAYGYIVQLHYFNRSGYPINETFDTQRKAEHFYNETIKELGA